MTEHNLIQIAVIEHKLIRQAIGKLLESFGIEICLEADDGRTFMEKVEKATVMPDICVIDINLQEADPFKMVAYIKERWPEMRILLLAIRDNESSIIKLMQMGANGYVLKGNEPSELRRALHDIYHKGFYNPRPFNGQYFHALLRENNSSALLSAPELTFLSLCTTELTYKEIAHEMKIATRTVETHRNNLFEKLSVKSRVGLAMIAMKMGLQSQ